MLRSIIDSVNPDQFLQRLSAIDQGRYKSTIPPLDRDEPRHYWIFRNMDFEHWNSANYPQVLWLSGPPECNIHQVSSYIVDLAEKKTSEPQNSVLYFFCSTASRKRDIATSFIHTLLSQIVSCSPQVSRSSVVRSFLHSLLDAILRRNEDHRQEPLCFKEGDSPDAVIGRILTSKADSIWGALKAVLDEQGQGCLIVVGGLDEVEHQKGEFIRELHAFTEHLQGESLKVKVLLTSRPQPEIKELFSRLPYIEYDKERKGMIAPYVLTLNQTHPNKMKSAFVFLNSIIHVMTRLRRSIKVPWNGSGRINSTGNGQQQMSPAYYIFKENLAVEKALLRNISIITFSSGNQMQSRLL